MLFDGEDAKGTVLRGLRSKEQWHSLPLASPTKATASRPGTGVPEVPWKWAGGSRNAGSRSAARDRRQ